MNVLIDTAAGPRCLSQHEAGQRITQLQQRLDKAECADQLRIQHKIDELAYGEWLA